MTAPRTPHPNPLPQGEGAPSPDSRSIRHAQTNTSLAPSFPLPRGEGRVRGRVFCVANTYDDSPPNPSPQPPPAGRGRTFAQFSKYTACPDQHIAGSVIPSPTGRGQGEGPSALLVSYLLEITYSNHKSTIKITKIRIMKNPILRHLICAGISFATVALFAAAIKEGYITRSLTVATNTAEVFFPQNPTKIMRLVSYDVNGDTNTAILTMYSGTMPLPVTGLVNVTNFVVTANTNVQTNALVLIQQAEHTI